MSGTTAPARWQWHADDYERAAAAGVFGPDPRVELWEGDVLTVASMLPGHAEAVRALCRRAFLLDQASFDVGSQTPVRLHDLSEPEPDLWIARGPQAERTGRHPTPDDLLLVVEVSDSSLRFDREQKVPGYAAAGVPEVWLVSLPERLVTVHRDPAPEGRRYRTTFDVTDRLEHPSTGLAVAVADLVGDAPAG